MLEGSGREAPPLPLLLRAAARAETWVAEAGRGIARARKTLRGEPLEVLVTLGWRLGDEVMALPVFEALGRARPGARVDARLRHPELLAGNPWVRRVNPLAPRPDLVLALKGEVPGEARRTTLARRARVPLDGVEPRLYLSEEERERPALPELGRLPRPRVAVHAASSQPCKGWGAERWREVAGALARDGAALVEVGSGRQGLGLGLDLIGRTDVRTLARVLAQCDLALGEDSGPLHLALAAGTPAVGVFGPTDPALLYPPRAPLQAAAAAGGCRFCWPARRLAYPSGRCPLPRHECMEAVPPARVIELARAALGARAARDAGAPA